LCYVRESKPKVRITRSKVVQDSKSSCTLATLCLGHEFFKAGLDAAKL
jgi:hypothetical protein